ncbi:MAG: PAS domain S-box protein, partial [Gammaproteobacteria bacterium]|nr:PAS domain S-box protein [Gammaproteobacteria bacterium]
MFVIVVLVVELIIGIAAINLTKNNFRHAMLDSFQSTITMTENFFSLIGQMGAGWSHHFKITEEHLIPMIKSPTVELNSDFLQHFKEESTADVVIILNQDRRVILHSASPELEGKSLKAWQIVEQTQSEQKAMVSIVQDLNNLIIYSSEPVFENSNEPPIGAIMVGYVINDQLISGMKKNTLTNISIIRRRGVMASTYNTPEGRLTDIPMNYITYQSLLTTKQNDYGDTTMLINDKEYFVYARSLTKIDPSMAGSLLLSYPESELQIIITEMLYRFILIGIISFLIIVIISWHFSKQLLSPLRHLLDKTSKLEEKEMTDTLIESDRNEIGALTHRFNILLQSIQKKNIKLNSQKELLEEAVKRRTQELEEKNTALENQDINLINAQRIANLGSWEWDHEKNILSCSPQFFKILGLQNISQLNHLDDFFTFIHIDDREIVAKKMIREEACKIEFRLCRPDGKQRNVIIEMEVIQWETNSSPVITSTLRDITESKRHEEEQISLQLQLQRSQKMETIGQLTGGIAHDFNNILASIMGYTELSLTRLEHNKDKKLRKFLHQISKSSERARDLVAQMKEFSRGRTEKIECVNLFPLVKDSLKMLGSILP